MARYIDEAELVRAIIRERDKIPLKTPCATYELLDEKPNQIGEAMRGGIRKALRCISEAPTADVVKVVRCKDCKWYQEGKLLAPNKFCFRLQHPPEDRKIGYNYAPDDFCSYGTLQKEG